MPEEKSAAPSKPAPLKSALTAATKPINTPANAARSTARPAAPKTTRAAAKPATKKTSKAPARPASKKPVKVAKIKVIRDSFTMPQNEYEEITKIKDIFKKAGMPVKKSEILRAGLKALVKLTIAQKKSALTSLEKIKTGRPNKH